MISIGSKTLETIEKSLLQRKDVRVFIRMLIQFNCLTLLNQTGKGVGRSKFGRRTWKVNISTCLCNSDLQGFPQFNTPVDQCNKALIIKIHIGQGRKSSLTDKQVDIRIGNADLAPFHCDLGKPLQDINQ